MACDFIALAVPGVQKLSPYQTGKPIEELQRELGLFRATNRADHGHTHRLRPLARDEANTTGRRMKQNRVARFAFERTV